MPERVFLRVLRSHTIKSYSTPGISLGDAQGYVDRSSATSNRSLFVEEV